MIHDFNKEELKFINIPEAKNYSENNEENLRVVTLDIKGNVSSKKVSELGGGGGSQDLQSVLTAGNYAEVSGEFSYIQLLGGNIQDRKVEVSITNADFSAGSNLSMNNNHAILSNSGNNTTGALSIDSGEVTLKQNVTNDSTKIIEVGFEDPIGSAHLKFPAKPDGTYTIATVDDITGSQNLQYVLDYGSSASLDGGSRRLSIFDPTETLAPADTFKVFSENTTTLKRGSIELNPDNIFLQSQNNTNFDFSAIDIASNQLTLYKSTSLGTITASFEEPSGGHTASLKFPNKGGGTYTLATLDDILNINLDSRVYANNATAITGGLVVKDLYRTATGEIRVVV